jgi:hypothetical protein
VVAHQGEVVLHLGLEFFIEEEPLIALRHIPTR